MEVTAISRSRPGLNGHLFWGQVERSPLSKPPEQFLSNNSGGTSASVREKTGAQFLKTNAGTPAGPLTFRTSLTYVQQGHHCDIYGYPASCESLV